MTNVLIVATAGLVTLLLVVEPFDTPWRLPIKALASTGFVAIGIESGALETRYGRMLLLGLVLAWVGDLLLALPARRAFLGGLLAFLLGHVAYVAAFAVRGLAWIIVALTAGGLAVSAWLVWRWLRPRLDAGMVGPVAVYVVVISVMVAAAFATAGFDLDLRIVVGAGLFYISDLFVARQRFVTAGFGNRLVGLPLYYSGQILLAVSVAG